MLSDWPRTLVAAAYARRAFLGDRARVQQTTDGALNQAALGRAKGTNRGPFRKDPILVSISTLDKIGQTKKSVTKA